MTTALHKIRTARTSHWAARGGAWLALFLILAATLLPSRASKWPFEPFCLHCLPTALVDALRNALLFVPLGFFLARSQHSIRRALGLCALLSLAIEIAQWWIPGRDSQLRDLLSNTFGAGLGAGAAYTLPLWWKPTPRGATVLLWSYIFAAVTGFSVSAFLLKPSLTTSAYSASWTPQFGGLDVYAGQLLDARLGKRPLPNGPLGDASRAVRLALLGGERLELSLIAGPSPENLAPLFTLQDAEQQEIFFLAAAGEDLYFSLRTRARAIGLDEPLARLPDALAGVAPGAPLSLTLTPNAARLCLILNNREHCADGKTLGSGWEFLFYPRWVPIRLAALGNGLWLCAFAVPLGYWLRTRRQALIAGGLWIALATAIPSVFFIAPTPLLEIAAPGIGTALGLYLRRLRLLREKPPSLEEHGEARNAPLI